MSGIRVIILLIIGVPIFFCVIGLGIWWLVLRISAAQKYLRSDSVRQEDAAVTRSLGETLRDHRARCQMTQEYVAEAIGVSRQAVSKWEKGLSSPSTTNLLALAKLYGVSVEELLKSVE